MHLNKSLAKSQATSIFNPVVWEQLKGVAQTFVESGAMPLHIKNAAQAVVVMSHGLDMGMSPTQALSSLYIVNGMVTIWGRAVIARLTQAGYSTNYQEGDSDNDKAWCEATVITPDGDKIEERFTFAEAKSSINVTDSSGNWKPGWRPGQNRKLKLRYGAINIILKTYLPHLLYGCNGIADIDGEVIQPASQETLNTEKIQADPRAFLRVQKGVIEGEAPSEEEARKTPIVAEEEVANE